MDYPFGVYSVAMSSVLEMPDRSTPRGRVAANVRAQLASAGVSAARAGRMLGISQSAISRRVSGDLAFDVDELGRLADLLGVDLVEFFSKPAGDHGPAGPAMQKSPSLGGLGLSLPDLDSNQEPPRSWPAPDSEQLAPVAQLELHRAAKEAAHRAVHSDHDAIVTLIQFSA